MNKAEWTFADAKAHFSELVDAAASGLPQTVTIDGKAVVVVLRAEDYERLTGCAAD